MPRTRIPSSNPLLSIEVELAAETEIAVSNNFQYQEVAPEPELSDDYLPSPIITEAKFIEMFKNREFNVSDEVYLMSNADAIKLWHTWLGDIQEKGEAGNARHGILPTQHACEELLKHRHQLPLGIDFYALSSGFKSIEVNGQYGRKTSALDYNKERHKTKVSPVAVHAYTPITVALTENDLDERSLKTYKKLAYDGEILNNDKSQFLLSNLTQLRHITLGDEEPVVKMLQHYWPNDRTAWQNIMRLSQTYYDYTQRVASKQHRLYLIASEESKKQLAAFSKRYPLSNANLNALLTLYQKPDGDRRLQKILAQWNRLPSETFRLLLNTAWKNMPGYAPLLSLEYQDALGIINSFSGAKARWWIKLLEQHYAAVGQDDLPYLVNAFKAFSNKIAEKGLAFYDPCHFTDAKSLPVTLSRMLTFLDNCKGTDVASQWRCITELSFQSNGAIRAISDQRDNPDECLQRRCTLLLPEMRLTPQHYDTATDHIVTLDKEDRVGYQASRLQYETLENLDKDAMREKFYRYLAHANPRLSLSFYRACIELLEKFVEQKGGIVKNSIRISLYVMLAGTTTNHDNEAYLYENEERYLEQWRNALHLLATDKTPKRIPDCVAIQIQLSNIAKCPIIPPMPLLMPLLSLFSRALKNTTQDMTDRIYTIDQLMYELQEDFLKKCLKKHFYPGMRFYATKNGVPPDIDFREYCDTAKGFVQVFYPFKPLVKGLRQEEIAKKLEPIYGSFVQLISAFNLNKDSVEKIMDCLREAQWSEAFDWNVKRTSDIVYLENVAYALEILAELQKNPKQEKDLLDFLPKLITIKRSDKRAVAALVERHFSECYEPKFFRELFEQTKKLPRYFSRNIQDAFPHANQRELVIDFFEKFVPDFADKELLSRTLMLLQKIGSGLEITDQNILLRALLKPSLYSSLPTLTEFNKLLELMARSDNGASFVYMMTKTAEADNQLLKKMRHHYQYILPMINSHNTTVSTDLMLPLLTQLLAKTPAAELVKPSRAPITSPIEIVEQDRKYFAEFWDRYSGTFYLTQQEVHDLLSELGINLKDKLGEYSDVAKQVIAASQQPRQKNQDFSSHVFCIMLNRLYTIAKHDTAIKDLLLVFFSQYSEQYQPTTDGRFISYLQQFLDALNQIVLIAPDKKLVLSLLHHFREPANPLIASPKTPKALLQILSHITALTDEEHQRGLLIIVNALLNNRYPVVPEQIAELCALIQAKKIDYKELMGCYTHAPYPKLEQILAWLQREDTTVAAQYQLFTQQRCPVELSNIIKLENVQQQAKKFKNLSKASASVFTEAATKNYVEKIIAAKTLSPDELFFALQDILLKSSPLDLEALIATVAAILHRTKGNENDSYSINHTQYLAISAMLRSPTHVTLQMATSEGKSRTSMVAMACLALLGKTVDFVTDNMQLARRDYLEYQDFFSVLKINTSLTFAKSPADEYPRDGGICFTDAANLSLFRNKARSEGLSYKVFAPVAKRVLFGDEVDRLYFDLEKTRFNYSITANQNLQDIEWVYSLVMEFFEQDKQQQTNRREQLFYRDIDACNREFFNFARGKLTDLAQLKKLRSFPLSDIETWHQAYFDAKKVLFNKQYRIEPNVLTQTQHGAKPSSIIQILQEKRVAKFSQLSYGAQQMLLTILNAKREQALAGLPATRAEEELYKTLRQCVYPFYIQQEKQILSSSTAKKLLDDYRDGDVYGVTGTPFGTILQRLEAEKLYGKKDKTMQFIQVPRQQAFLRKDLPVRLTANFARQMAALQEYIAQARKKSQPILIVCEDDEESLKIHNFLAAKLQGTPLQHIHSGLSLEAEAQLIETAGSPQMVTIATSAVGRGTHIKLQNLAITHGLHLLKTYVSLDEREEEQVASRTARRGDEGQERLVLNKEKLKQQLGKTTLTDGFYYNAEDYLRHYRQVYERKQQVERIIRQTVGDFRERLAKEFFDKIKQPAPVAVQLAWITFNRDADKCWNEVFQKMMARINFANPNKDFLNQQFAGYTKSIEKPWKTLLAKIQKYDPKAEVPEDIFSLKLSRTSNYLLQPLNPRKNNVKIPTATAYDEAYAGRAVKYRDRGMFFELKESLAGRRKLFPNTRACLKNEGIIFPNLRAKLFG